ncbi:MAG: energy transducer TonB [Rhodospirillales bacterium]|nr:energy transducer TonB [Rhodospirillales bacterium]
MALSFALHGLAVLPLFLIAGTLGSTSQEPALFVELALAAPTVGANAEPDSAPAETVPPQSEPPPPAVETAAQTPEAPKTVETTPEPEAVPEIVVDLPPPEEPPPVKVTDLKPVEPPKPKPAASKPAPTKPAVKPANVAQAATSPDAGNAAVTQQAATAPADAIVWEGKPRYRVPPKPAVYPARAIELGQQGEVLVRVRLDPDGSAAEIRLWRGSGFDLLDRAALAAVRGWHFLPARRGGHAVAAWVEIPIRFHLH